MAFDALETQAADMGLLRRLSNATIIPAPKLDLKPIEQLKALLDEWKAKDWAEINAQPCAMFQFRLFLREKNQETRLDLVEQVEKFKRAKNKVEEEVVDDSKHAEDLKDENGKPLPIWKDKDTSDLSRRTLGARILRDFFDVSEETKANPLNYTNSAVIETIKANLKKDEVPLDTFDAVVSEFQRSFQEHITDFKNHKNFQTFIQHKDFCARAKSEDDFSKIRVLGRGAFGAVHAVSSNHFHKVYAYKEISKKHIKKAGLFQLVMNERNILADVDSFFVLSLKSSLQTESHLVLLFDICTGGDLRFHLKHSPDRRFNLERARFYTAETILGLEHLHSRRIVYRDLKPDNVLLEEAGHCRISDLGLATKIPEGKKIKEMAGTAGYWAPEVLARKFYDVDADWFSLGVLLYEMLTGRIPKCTCNKENNEWCPFNGSDSHDHAAKHGGNLKIDIEYPADKIPEDAQDLLQKLLHPDPEQRLGKNGAAEIKAHKFFESINWAKLEAVEVKPPYKPTANQVNAASLQEVGQMNESKFDGVKIEPADEESYKKFLYVSEVRFQSDLVVALRKWDFFNMSGGADQESGGCCTIL